MTAINQTLHYKQATDFLEFRYLKKVISDAYELMGYDPTDIPIDSILSFTQHRNNSIRMQYNEARKQGIKSEAVIAELAEKYNLSYEYVWSVAHGRR